MNYLPAPDCGKPPTVLGVSRGGADEACPRKLGTSAWKAVPRLGGTIFVAARDEMNG